MSFDESSDSIRRNLFVAACCILVISIGSVLLYRYSRMPEPQKTEYDPDRLVVLTRNSSITYYEGPEGPLGFEYDMVTAFARELGMEVELKVKDSVAEILKAIDNGEGDLAASSLTRTDERQKTLLFGPNYMTVQQQLVCRMGRSVPKSIEDILGSQILVIDKSSYIERLAELKIQYPSLEWETEKELSTENIMEMVWNEEVEYTVADSNIVEINRRYYPELVSAFPISEEQFLAWVFNKNRQDLCKAAYEWFKKFDESGELSILHDRYYGYVNIFNYVDLSVYHRHIIERLPVFQHIFKEASQAYGLPWKLIAAQAYQESKWDSGARSPTGVRGIMMLTMETAEHLKVANRLDPVQSIWGGAKYLKQLIERVPEEFQGQDRIAYALASYNVGIGHVRDAQTLAGILGKDPNSWIDIKEVLPLLSQKKYYKRLTKGYARGREPVLYVDRIFNYWDILEQESVLTSRM